MVVEDAPISLVYLQKLILNLHNNCRSTYHRYEYKYNTNELYVFLHSTGELYSKTIVLKKATGTRGCCKLGQLPIGVGLYFCTIKFVVP